MQTRSRIGPFRPRLFLQMFLILQGRIWPCFNALSGLLRFNQFSHCIIIALYNTLIGVDSCFRRKFKIQLPIGLNFQFMTNVPDAWTACLTVYRGTDERSRRTRFRKPTEPGLEWTTLSSDPDGGGQTAPIK